MCVSFAWRGVTLHFTAMAGLEPMQDARIQGLMLLKVLDQTGTKLDLYFLPQRTLVRLWADCLDCRPCVASKTMCTSNVHIASSPVPRMFFLTGAGLGRFVYAPCREQSAGGQAHLAPFPGMHQTHYSTPHDPPLCSNSCIMQLLFVEIRVSSFSYPCSCTHTLSPQS
jgi:hypothetical protein